MINKLYNLKKTQTDQALVEKGQILLKIENLDAEIDATYEKIRRAKLDTNGLIYDFEILTMHKNAMRMHISELNKKRINLNTKLEQITKQIVELQKETEQFGYLLDEEKKEAIKKALAAEQEAAEEFMQSKYNSR